MPLWLQILLWSMFALVFITILVGVVCDTISKAIIKVCRELKTLNIKERN